MQIFINQKPVTLQGQSLGHLCAQMQWPQAGIAVAVNGTIIPVSSWDQFTLHPNDQVTVIRATRGG